MASKRVYGNGSGSVSGFIDDDGPRLGDKYAIGVSVPHGDAPAMTVRWYLTTDRARAHAADLIAAADAVDAAVAAAQTLPLPEAAPKAGIVTALALLLGLALNACATAPRPAAEVETVGQLAASDTHVMQAPVAPTTDLSRGSFVASDADDAPVTVGAGEAATPDIAPKAGLVMGGVR